MAIQLVAPRSDLLWRQARDARLSRRRFLALAASGGAAAVLAACMPASTHTITPAPPTPSATLRAGRASSTPAPAATPTPTPQPVTYARLPRWRGFNLLEKFTLQDNGPYQEWDFDFMVEWGFDFVRLPTDYRIWAISPGEYREQPLKEIDQAIEWGRARGIHVNLCLHRAPGYTVNAPPEPLDLWADDAGGEEARRQFAEQWGMFAARYKGIPSAELSFDLVNEPGEITGEQYLRAARSAVEAIRAQDPQRLIIADGLYWGRRPVAELAPLQIAQSTRGYDPMQISHYRADWIEGSAEWPVPTWPMALSLNQFLYGTQKPEFQAPLILKGDFATEAQLSVRVNQVSDWANFVIQADGVTILEKWFEPGPGEGEWQESTYMPEWDIYQAVYDKVYTTTIPAGTRELRFELTEGDWLTLSEIRIDPYPGAPGGKLVIPFEDWEWGVLQETYTVSASGVLTAASGRAGYNRAALWADYVEPWKVFSEIYGIGVHVCEWGAYSYTPHDVALAWMRDCLDNWKQVGMGWALWNLRGSFGVLDSERTDVQYESYKGHQLDREMLESLVQG